MKIIKNEIQEEEEEESGERGEGAEYSIVGYETKGPTIQSIAVPKGKKKS